MNKIDLRPFTPIDVASLPPRAAEFVKLMQARARDMSQPPSPQSRNKVKCRGERLSRPIYWVGGQWAVTSYGVEARDGCYAIAKDRIWENEERYGWVLHMSEKNWIYLADFAEALRVARMRWLHAEEAK